MGKYPILQTLSGLARFVDWIALIIAAIILFVGISKVLGALSEDSRPTNDPALYQGILQSFAALGMALTALILILVGEVIKVFVDIEGNTSETTRLLRSHSVPISSIASRPAQRSYQPNPTDVFLQADGPMTDDKDVQEIIESAKAQGFDVDIGKGHKISFSKKGGTTYCYSRADVLRFGDRIRA